MSAYLLSAQGNIVAKHPAFKTCLTRERRTGDDNPTFVASAATRLSAVTIKGKVAANDSHSYTAMTIHRSSKSFT
jgi:hypothetical protein